MLVVRNEDEGVWVDHTFRGAAIRLKIRPSNAAKINEINRNGTTHDFVKDPETRQMVKVASPDSKAIFRNMVDHFLESFEGIGYAPDKPWPVNIDNKMKVVNLPTGPNADEKGLWDFIMTKARELAIISTEEAKAIEGN